MKNIFKLMSVLLLSGSVLSFAACGDDDTPEDVQETLPVMSFTNVGTEGIVLSDVGATSTVQVALTPSDLPNIDKYYYVLTSENEKVFTVTQEGVVTAVGQGQAMLRATTPNNTGVSAACRVTVKGDLVTSITIADEGKEIVLTRDGTYPTFNLGQYVTVGPLTATTPVVRYVSSDEDIVRIDENGLVKAFGWGTATIRVEATDGSGVYDEAVAKISSYEYSFLDRSAWSITSSPTSRFTPTGTSDEYGGPIEYLIDDNSQDTRVGLLKALAPGGPEDGILYFTLDLGSPQPFNYFRWEGGWTNGNSANNNVKINRINFLYGSNESINGPWETLQTDIAISGSYYDQTITLTGSGGTTLPPFNYRYVRVEVRPNQAAITNNVIAVLWRDFKLGYRELLGPEM